MKQTKRGKLVEFLLTNPTREFHLRGLSRAVGMSPAGILKALKETEIASVTKNKENNLTTIKANRESEEFKARKKSFNLLQIYQSGLFQYLIDTYNHPEAIVLFGSYEKGEDTEESDIDIAIITNHHKKLNLKKYETALSRTITIKELAKEKIEKEFWNTLANGIVLTGYLDLPK
jgi:predicted nucleotidyltransferase